MTYFFIQLKLNFLEVIMGGGLGGGGMGGGMGGGGMGGGGGGGGM